MISDTAHRAISLDQMRCLIRHMEALVLGPLGPLTIGDEVTLNYNSVCFYVEVFS